MGLDPVAGAIFEQVAEHVTHQLRGVRLALVSAGVDPALEAALGMRIFVGREEAAAWARGLLPASSRGLLVEDAGNVTLEIAKTGAAA